MFYALADTFPVQGVFRDIATTYCTMPLPHSPELSDWPTFGDFVLQLLANAEFSLRQLLPTLTVLTGIILVVSLLVWALKDLRRWWLARKAARLRLQQEKFQKTRIKIADKGQAKRLRLAKHRQRRNLQELAVLVKAQLKSIKQRMQPHIYDGVRIVIARSVTDLDFDRLYSLHRLLAQADAPQLVPRLERLVQQVR